MAAGEDVDDLIKRTKKISRQELRSKTSGGGRSTEFAKYRKLALSLEPGGAGAEVDRLTESQVSSIRTQINHLNPDDADDDEKEFVATRRKKTTDAGEDITDDEGNQLYDLFISREKVDEEPETTAQSSEKPEEKETSQSDEESQVSSEVEKDFEGMWD
jgi:hypothetical protein